MKIILGSNNISKKRSLEGALAELEIVDGDIICIDSNSDTHSKPIGYEIIRGADNRNKNSRSYAKEHNIEFDYLCAIEGGFSLDENGIPFVVTYAIIEDKNGEKSTGKSVGVRIRKDMFDYVKNGNSINRLIESIIKKDNNKQLQGITGYLTNGLYLREKIDKDAVVLAFIPFLHKEKRDLLSSAIKKLDFK